MKNTRNKVSLTESKLHRVIKESVRKVLKESTTATEIYNSQLGRLEASPQYYYRLLTFLVKYFKEKNWDEATDICNTIITQLQNIKKDIEYYRNDSLLNSTNSNMQNTTPPQNNGNSQYNMQNNSPTNQNYGNINRGY